MKNGDQNTARTRLQLMTAQATRPDGTVDLARLLEYLKMSEDDPLALVVEAAMHSENAAQRITDAQTRIEKALAGAAEAWKKAGAEQNSAHNTEMATVAYQIGITATAIHEDAKRIRQPRSGLLLGLVLGILIGIGVGGVIGMRVNAAPTPITQDSR